MEPAPSLPPEVPQPAVTWHGAVTDFKRRLLEQALRSAGGNRTHAARALGLQRTYLLRLIRDFGVEIPPARREGCKAASRTGDVVPGVFRGAEGDGSPSSASGADGKAIAAELQSATR